MDAARPSPLTRTATAEGRALLPSSSRSTTPSGRVPFQQHLPRVEEEVIIIAEPRWRSYRAALSIRTGGAVASPRLMGPAR